MNIYIVDAFTETSFTGNPAGVCILEKPIADQLMLNIAKEVNHSETAFAVKRDMCYHLRWFTPQIEVPLCGHATLATAHILWEQQYEQKAHAIQFATQESGVLTVTNANEMIVMDFPQKFVILTSQNELIRKALHVNPIFIGCDEIRYLLEVEHEQEVRTMYPDFELLKRLNKRVIITARSVDPKYDFVSRVFAPSVGVNEDPVTGSAHCYLAPYWAKKLNKTTVIGYQASFRPGCIRCELLGQERVLLKGTAKTVIKGELFL
ncbi:MAG: PhzF family phenazine biosynthesis protein [Bacteroidota bacterium]|jgi:PhzF family phenazine biosynthesis protein